MNAISPLAGSTCLRPLIKWTGGKSRELDIIRASMPHDVGRVVEPFVGGGAVFLSVPSGIPALANDMSRDLVGLYRGLAAGMPGLLDCTLAIDRAWRATGLLQPGRKHGDDALCGQALLAAGPLTVVDTALPEMVAGEASRALARKRRALARLADQEGGVLRPEELLASALKAAVYTALRSWHNAAPGGPGRLAAFWFLREFCYGGMFRTNAAGGSNVPYGGMSYDSRGMDGRLAQVAAPAMAARLAATDFHQGDFATFLRQAGLRRDDFVFLDPPYDSAFSTYDGNAFGRADHCRLAAAMQEMPCPWMLVISETEFVRDLYCGLPGARTTSFHKGYAVNIKQRFDRGATHLMVTSYDPPRRLSLA